MQDKKERGVEVAKPSDFKEMTGNRDKKSNASWSKMPKNDGPFDMPSGKSAGKSIAMPDCNEGKKK